MNNKRGSALVVVVMIVTILFILSAGFFTVVNSTTSLAKRQLTKTRLLISAESGVNHTFRFLRRVKGPILRDKVQALNLVNVFNSTDIYNSISINGIVTQISISFDPSTNAWAIVSVASENGENCQVSIENIIGGSMAGEAMALGGDMISGTNFFTGNKVLGPSFFRGWLRFSTLPNFYGPVSSSTKIQSTGTKSYQSTSKSADVQNFYRNNLDGVYKYGLTDISSRNETDIGTEKRMTTTFEGGYNQTDDVDPGTGVTYSWDEFNGINGKIVPEEIKAFKVPHSWFNSKREDLEVIFNGSSSAPTAVIKSRGVVKTTIFLGEKSGQYNTILVSKNSNSAKHVKVKGCIYNNVVLVTESNDAIITGDIYYDGLQNHQGKDYTKLKQSEANSRTKVGDLKQIVADMPQKFGIIAGLKERADILIHYSNARDSSPSPSDYESSYLKNDALLLCGGFFTPYGIFGSYRLQKSSNGAKEGYDQSLWQYKNYFKKYNSRTRVVLIGSLFMTHKGVYAHSSGISPFLASDMRFVDKGERPLGYKTATMSDSQDLPVNKITSSMKWTVKYY